jgi:hypothetical protein
MTKDEAVLSVCLAAGWIIRAIEEYGVGGPHKPDSERFILTSQDVLMRLGAMLIDLGVVQEGETVTDVVRRVLIAARQVKPSTPAS